MKLSNLSKKERENLAKKVGTSQLYLYQLGRGIRKGSVEFMQKINKADPRFKLSDLRPDIWGES